MYRKEDNRSKDELLLEIERLSIQLAEAEETLNAIRSGEVDALVVSGDEGEQVFTLKGAEHPYRVFIEKMHEGAIALAADGSILYCNSGFSRIVRKPIENIIGSGISQFVSQDSINRFDKMLKRGEISSWQGEINLLSGDGTIVPARLSINQMQTVNEWTIYIVVTDLTNIREKEKALQESETQKKALLDNSPDVIILIDTDMKIQWANKTALDMNPAAIGQTCYKAYAGGDEPCKDCPCAIAIRTGLIETAVMYQSSVVSITGESYWEDIGVPLKDDDGKVVNVIEIARNVTKSKLAEKELLEARDELELRVNERTAELAKTNQALQAEIIVHKWTEGELRLARQKLQDIIEFLPDATFVIDAEKKVISWNRAIEEMTGVPKDQILGKGDYAYAVPFYGKRRPILLDYVFADCSETENEYTTLKKKGNCLYAERYVPYVYEGKGAYLWALASPLFDASGKQIGAIETIHDMTEHKRIEDELRFRNIILSTQQETPLDGILAVDDNQMIVSFNQRFIDMWDIPAEVIESRSNKRALESIIDKLVDPKAFLEGVEYLYEHIEEKGRAEIALIDGRTLDRYSSPIVGPDGKYYGRIWYFRDISEQKLAEDKLRNAYKRLSDIIEFLPDAIFVIDAEMKVIAWNRATEEMTGIKKEDILGKGDYAYAIPFYGERRPILINLIFGFDSETEKKYDFLENEGRMVYAETFVPCLYNGKGGYIRGRASPLFDGNGKWVGAIESVRDITERKNVEEALRASEEKYRSVVESVDFSVSLIDRELCYVGCNRKSLEILGYSAEDIAGRPIIDIIKYPDEKEFYLKNLHRIFDSRTLETHEHQLYVNGNKTWYSVTMAPVFDTDDNVSAVTCVGIDISKRKRAEEALQKSEEKYRNIVETAQEGIWVINKDGKTIYVNKRIADMLGYSMKKMLGCHLFSFMDDEARILAENKLERRKQGISEMYELRFRRKDGSDLWTLLSVNPIMDSSGQYNGALGMITDISDLKKMEEIRLQNETLIYANTVKSEFMSVMSHELRTPLSSIIGYSQLMKEKINGELNDRQEFYVDNILEGSKHLLNLINSILDTAQIEAGKMLLVIEEVSVPDTIESLIHFIGEQAKAHNVILIKEMDPELDIIEVDKQKFKQIMLNLLGNAIKFSKPEGGIVTIWTKNDGDMARISVSDRGIGIRDKDLKRLFLKFEQLDSGVARKYEGTGLGLSITQQLVKMHGGTIKVESKYGKGSTFTFSIPIKQKSGSSDD